MKKLVALNCVCADVFVEIGEIHPGGEALNVCGNASEYKEIECCLMGAVGEDEFGQAIRDKLTGYAVNTEYLQTEKGSTANNRIYLTEDGDRYFHDDSWTGGVYQEYELREKDIACLKQADVVHITLFAPPFRKVLQLRKESRFLLAADFNSERSFPEWEEYLPQIDVFFISGEEKILPILQEWSKRYKTVFVATLAAEGSVAYADGTEYRCKAVPVEQVVDTTGAGDSYQAGFLVSYVMDKDIQKAMQNGSKQAAKTLQHLGGF